MTTNDNHVGTDVTCCCVADEATIVLYIVYVGWWWANGNVILNGKARVCFSVYFFKTSVPVSVSVHNPKCAHPQMRE